MAVSGNKTQVNVEFKRAGLQRSIFVQSVPLDADGQMWPCGLVMGKGPNGYVPYEEIASSLGTGNGSEMNFLGDVKGIEPGTAEITDGTETFTDDGFGSLAGDAGGSGSINYETGKVAASFNAAPAADADISMKHKPAPWAVLDQETDTSSATSALAVKSGAVRKAEVKIGVSAKAAPDAAVISLLEQRHIYAI